MTNKYPKEVKQECLKLFLEGKSLKEVAALKHIPFETIKKWHLRNNWAKENEKTVLKVSEKIQKNIAEENAKEIFDARQKLIEHIKHLEQVLDTFCSKEMIDNQPSIKLKDSKPNIMQLVLIFNALHKYLYTVAKIDGLLSDKTNSEDPGMSFAITRIMQLKQILIDNGITEN